MIELNLPGCKLSVNAGAAPVPGPVGRMWRLLRGADLPLAPTHAAASTSARIALPVAAAEAGWAECVVDQAARDAWRDPVQFRRERLPADSRARRVLDEAARRARWSRPLAAGQARGIAMAGPGAPHGAVVACVVQVSQGISGAARLQRVVAAVDCGAVIDLDEARHDVARALREALPADLGDADSAVIEVWWVCSEASCSDRAEAASAAVGPAVRNALDALRDEGERARALAGVPQEVAGAL